MNTNATNGSYPIIYTSDIFGLNVSETAGKIIALEAGYSFYDYYAQTLNATGVVALSGTDQSVQLSIPVVPYANVDEQTGSDIVNFINTTTYDLLPEFPE